MTSIIITLLIVLYRIPLINILGDKGMGYYSSALVIYLVFMTFIAYGLPDALSSLLIKHHSKGHYTLVVKTIQGAFLFALVFGGISALFLFFGADFIASYLLNAKYSAFAIRAFAPCVLFISVLGVFHGTFIALRVPSLSQTAHNIERIFVALLSIAGAVLFANIGKDAALINGDLAYEDAYSAMGAGLGLTCGVCIACIFSFIFFRSYYKKLNRMVKKDITDFSLSYKDIINNLLLSMMPFAMTLIIFHISSLFDYAIFNRIMSVQGHKESSYIILLGMLNGKYEFFISIPLLIINWYASKKLPVLTRIVQAGSKRKLHIKIGQITRGTMLFMIPCTMLFMLYSQSLMDLLFTGTNDVPSILLKTGAVSIIFYSLTAISNITLNALEDWACVTRNAMIALVVQIICLLIMMIIFQWGIVAVVISRLLFSASFYILNEHTLREKTGYVQEHKRTFVIPVIASLIMGIFSFIIYVILELFIVNQIAVLISVIVGIPVYIMSLVFLGGITQREMYRLPGGKCLAPLCRKLHLLK